jgi:hypothetical protein
MAIVAMSNSMKQVHPASDFFRNSPKRGKPLAHHSTQLAGDACFALGWCSLATAGHLQKCFRSLKPASAGG